MAVISNIQRNYGNMFSAEKRAADFILQYSEELIEQNYTISELAARCGASEASIIRMCKRIGYAGFASLKITLARELELREVFAPAGHLDDTMDISARVRSLTRVVYTLPGGETRYA